MSFDGTVKKSADTSEKLHPLLQERWSPRAFDESYRISDQDLLAVLEAGRWSPSSNNYQPWRFIVGKRGNEKFNLISSTLSGFNAEWAPKASVYIVLNALMVDDSNQPRNQSLYDLGIASAFMTLEANHRGFAVHQVGGFDRVKLHELFNLPEETKPIAILVLGKQIGVETIANEDLAKRERASRSRKSLSEITLASD